MSMLTDFVAWVSALSDLALGERIFFGCVIGTVSLVTAVCTHLLWTEQFCDEDPGSK